MTRPVDIKTLKRRLNGLYRTYDKAFIFSDPIEFVHKFKNPLDREVAGLIASSLAYGRVSQIKKSIGFILSVMGNEPHGFTMEFKPYKYKKAFADFRHRFNTGHDVLCLIYFIKQMFLECGSIKGFFLKGYNDDDKNVKNALASFSERASGLDNAGIYGQKRLPADAGVRFFFPSPKDGSPCKRLNLYLRWMARHDKVDFGLWREVSPEKLIMPLDTHVARISRYMGLTRRHSPGWNMAEEITGNLKLLDPKDPVKYDFSISRLGIVEGCGGKNKTGICKRCIIKDVCVVR